MIPIKDSLKQLKIYQQVGGECTNSYQKPDGKQKQFWINSVKLNKSEKRDNYVDLARELKIWNIKVRVMPILIGTFGTVTIG